MTTHAIAVESAIGGESLGSDGRNEREDGGVQCRPHRDGNDHLHSRHCNFIAGFKASTEHDDVCIGRERKWAEMNSASALLHTMLEAWKKLTARRDRCVGNSSSPHPQAQAVQHKVASGEPQRRRTRRLSPGGESQSLEILIRASSKMVVHAPDCSDDRPREAEEDESANEGKVEPSPRW